MRWALVLLGLVAGCRGQVSEKPPVHLFDDMDQQPKYRPQAESRFFADGRTMRPRVEGTVARGELVAPARPEATAALAVRGRERFDVYCAPCHDRSGGGHGMVVRRGFPPPIDLASERARGLSDDEVFEVITRGVRNMPAYGAQVPPEDRWAIVLWLRVLQRSQRASVEDVPEEQRERIEPEDVR